MTSILDLRPIIFCWQSTPDFIPGTIILWAVKFEAISGVIVDTIVILQYNRANSISKAENKTSRVQSETKREPGIGESPAPAQKPNGLGSR